MFEIDRIEKNGVVRTGDSRDLQFVAGAGRQILIEGLPLQIMRDKVGVGENAIMEADRAQEEGKNDTRSKTKPNCFGPFHREQSPKPVDYRRLARCNLEGLIALAVMPV